RATVMLRGSKSDTVRRGHHGGLKRRRDRAGGYRHMARAPFRVGQKQNEFPEHEPWLPNDRPDVGALAGDVHVNVTGHVGMVASLQDVWNRACEAASSCLWKVPSADGVVTSTMTTCVFSPEPAILVSNKYDTTALRFTNSSNTGVTTSTSAESYAFSWPGRT